MYFSLGGDRLSLSLGSLLMAAAGGVREVEEGEGEEVRKKRVRADDRCVPNLPIATNQIESITHSESELLLVKTVRGTSYLLDTYRPRRRCHFECQGQGFRKDRPGPLASTARCLAL